MAEPLPSPITESDYRHYPDAQIKLGRLLFYDRVLSGTRRVSCATCHNHDRASSNGFRLDGKKNTGTDELAVSGLEIYDALKPSSKHAPALFNLGAEEFQTLFSNGRVARSAQGFETPSDISVPDGLNDVLAVQALFPAIADDELLGILANKITAVAHLGNAAIWNATTQRVRDLEEYWPHVKMAYPRLDTISELSIADIANAIGAFVGTEWRSDASPFDLYLRGDKTALNEQQKRGMSLFYGEAGCSTCHAGKFQTDHQFHFAPLGLWRFDTELGDKRQTVNYGRSAVTDLEKDQFSYRTPSLRNVAYTAPYGHAGSVEKLEDAVRAHLYLSEGWHKQYLEMFDRLSKDADIDVDLIVDFALGIARADAQAPKLEGLNDPVADLTAFLQSLSDEKALKGRLGKPEDVPSSLALD